MSSPGSIRPRMDLSKNVFALGRIEKFDHQLRRSIACGIGVRYKAPMNEQRLIDIETKLAHQEILIEELNRVISQQQADISELEKAVKILAKKARSETKPIGPADQRPPHY